MNDSNRALHKIGALDAGSLHEIGHQNWHVISAGIELTIRSLSGRPLNEFHGALKQLEELMPELAIEIGSTKEILDLPKVNFLQRFIAMILEKSFPAFHAVTQRAEMRELAHAKLSGLERVHDKLQELREELNDRIADEAMKRASEDGNHKLVEEYEKIQKRRREIRETRVRLDEIFTSRFVRRNTFEVEYLEEVAEMNGFLHSINNVTGTKFPDSDRHEVVSLNEVRSVLIGFHKRTDDEYAKLNRQLESLVRNESPKLT